MYTKAQATGLEGVVAPDANVEANGFRKDDSSKPRMSLIPFDVLYEVAKVFTYGAHKYSAHNYRRGTMSTRYVDAALRHITAWLSGEDEDMESGYPHLDHAICSLMMLRGMELHHVNVDDRFVSREGQRESETEEYPGE